MSGLLLALQFFTSIPVHRTLPMGRKEVTTMYLWFPFIGLLLGFTLFGVAYLSYDVLGFSAWLTAVVTMISHFWLTGGLHLDGFADTSDAFFSYREREKRLAILEDPRIGAFGTLSIVLFIGLKGALITEWLLQDQHDWIFFLTAPLLARTTLMMYFVSTPLAKEKGLGFFLQQQTVKTPVFWTAFCFKLIWLFVLGFFLQSLVLPITLFIVTMLCFLFYRRWSMKHFGGMSGDLSGALIEGMEGIVWFVLIVYF